MSNLFRMMCFLSMTWIFGSQQVHAEPVYYPGTTSKVHQITGDWDRSRIQPTTTLTETRAGLISTDLGSSFEHEGKLYFLFGDSHGRSGDPDFLAWSASIDPEQFDMTIPTAADGKFRVIHIPGIAQDAFCVPSYGISVNGAIYIVHTTDWSETHNNMERSVVARSTDDGVTWEYLYTLSVAENHDMSQAHFINVSLAHGQASSLPSLPQELQEAPVIFMWGSGAYRNSSPHLAVALADNLGSADSWYYFSGLDQEEQPSWSRQQRDSVPLFHHPQLGEFSVAWIAQLERWVMLYNSASPRGIVMRTAQQPWGAWSNPHVIFDPWRDGGYGNFMHVPFNFERRDWVHDPGRELEWGGEYGPYLIPRFTTGDASRCTLYYTLSIWNPYAVVIMRSDVGAWTTENEGSVTSTSTIVGSTDWLVSDPASFVSFTHRNQSWITTWTPEQGDTATGWMAWQLPEDAFNERLQFHVHGGSAEVILLKGGNELPSPEQTTPASLYAAIKRNEYGKVVFATRGHNTNDHDVRIDWLLTPYRSDQLKVVVIDREQVPWGFISVSPMILTRRVSAVQQGYLNTW